MIVPILRGIHAGLKLLKPLVDAATEPIPQPIQAEPSCKNCGTPLDDLHAAVKVGGLCPSCAPARI